jgi:16S rRNA pseudouridine516 synthase
MSSTASLPPETTRLDQLLARNLGITRKEAQNLVIRRQLVDAHGEPFASKPFPKVPAPLHCLLHRQPITLFDRIVLIQNKPAGVVTAREDRIHPTAYASLRQVPLYAELLPVGRLDLDATGLLFWTNDGGLVHRLTHPKRGVARTYHVALARPFRRDFQDLTLRDGYEPMIDALNTVEREAVHPSLQFGDDAQCFASITVHAGAYHEVKRIFAALDSHVLGLCRVQHAGFDLPREMGADTWQILDDDTVTKLG